MNPASTPAAAAVDQVERATKPGLLLLLLVCLVGAVGALIMLPGEIGRKAVSSTIAVLAIFGVFGLLMYAFGLLQFAGRAGRLDTTKAIADSNDDGLIVTDAHSRVVYANDAYRTLSAAKGAADLRPGRAAVFRRAGRFRSDLPARAGGPRPANAASRNCASRRRWPAKAARPGIASACARSKASQKTTRRCGPSPTSRANANATRVFFRTCSM